MATARADLIDANTLGALSRLINNGNGNFTGQTYTIDQVPTSALVGVEGQAVSGKLAVYTDSLASTADLSANILWGDGSSSAGTIVDEHGGTFAVEASHTYMAEGPYVYAVQIIDTANELDPDYSRPELGLAHQRRSGTRQRLTHEPDFDRHQYRIRHGRLRQFQSRQRWAAPIHARLYRR